MGDQLRNKRIQVLADEIEQTMRRNGHPAYGELAGRIVLDVTPMTLVDTRRAARLAGDRVGWRVSTHVRENQLLVVDRRLPNHEVSPWVSEMFRSHDRM